MTNKLRISTGLFLGLAIGVMAAAKPQAPQARATWSVSADRPPVVAIDPAAGQRAVRGPKAAQGLDKKALYAKAEAQCRAILDHVARMSGGWAANTVPVLWENARKRCAVAAK